MSSTAKEIQNEPKPNFNCIKDDGAPYSIVRFTDTFVDSLEPIEVGIDCKAPAIEERTSSEAKSLLRLYLYGAAKNLGSHGGSHRGALIALALAV